MRRRVPVRKQGNRHGDCRPRAGLPPRPALPAARDGAAGRQGGRRSYFAKIFLKVPERCSQTCVMAWSTIHVAAYRAPSSAGTVSTGRV